MAEVQAHTVERTLVLLKPDALARGLAGRIITRFEDAALKIVGTKMKWMDEEFTRKHYFDLEERLGSEVYNLTASATRTTTPRTPRTCLRPREARPALHRRWLHHRRTLDLRPHHGQPEAPLGQRLRRRREVTLQAAREAETPRP
nr:nucleoside-diphosphate kinase [Streptomyces sp. CC224B]